MRNDFMLTNWKVIWLLIFLLGVSIGLQIQTISTEVKYTSIKDMYAFSIELESQQSEVEQLKIKIEDIKNQVATYQLAKTDERIDYAQFLADEIELTKEISGITPVQGPGVVIVITDGTRELGEDENPNNVLVHDIDIRALVDDLRNAGAEAISINNERVIFNKSNIQCTGPTIKVNDQVFAPPYIIQAIGDRKFLESAINSPDSYSESLRQWGLFVEVNTSVNIMIPKYEGFVEYLYTN